MLKFSCWLTAGVRVGLAAGVVASTLAVGCNNNREVETPPAAAPGVTYTGPAYLRNTVGSLARLRNNGPMPVSGFGFVTGLQGTGHRGAPAFLRQRIIQEMKKGGFGSASLGTRLLTPERALDDINTAVVAIEGLIPPGATAGTRFDVLISALPGTETTSLAGGTLFSADLAPGGVDMANRYSRPLARARGELYLNPFDDQTIEQDAQDFQRQAIIVGGGVVTEDRQIEIVLNQPSWRRARAIEDRINERFPMSPDDRLTKTANAISNLVVRINVPKRYASAPSELLGLISVLYVNNAPQFEPRQARRLFEELERDPETVEDVALALKALGKTVTPVLREHYQHERQDIRLTALEAGAYLKDERASEHLLELAGSDDAALRVRVARALVHLPRSMRGGRALKQLLDDEEVPVRVAAYESLARIGDPIVERVSVRNEAGIKFVIDRVPATRPLVYITYRDVPRVVIFNPQLGFDLSEVARLWNNRLMLRMPETLPEALAGLEPGGTVFVPIHSRGALRETGAPRWEALVTDAGGYEAMVVIESQSLHDRFVERVKPDADRTQAVMVAQLVERQLDGQTGELRPRLRLLDLNDPDAQRPVTVYYQGPRTSQGKTYKIQPTVATLAFMLAHKSTMDSPQPGLNLSYSDVVDALYRLCQAGHVGAPIEVDTTPLARLITQQEQTTGEQLRPETGGETEPAASAGPQPRPVTPDADSGLTPTTEMGTRPVGDVASEPRTMNQ